MRKTIHSEAYKAFRLWLRGKREEKGLTLRQVGTALGCPHTFISKVENSERRIDVVEYVTYCKAIGIDMEEGLKIILTHLSKD